MSGRVQSEGQDIIRRLPQSNITVYQATAGSDDPSVEYDKDEIAVLHDVACAAAVKVSERDDPDSGNYDGTGSKMATLLGKGEKHVEAVDMIEQQLFKSREFHNFCASESDACTLYIPEQVPNTAFDQRRLAAIRGLHVPERLPDGPQRGNSRRGEANAQTKGSF
jgi:hypothetical protein